MGYLPNGFTDTSGSTLPLRMRKPSTPYGLFRVIVDRFTGLLFATNRMPAVNVADAPELDDFVKALIKTSRFWPAMKRARTFAGAQGSVAIGFQVMRGVPLVEVHDARWLQPTFVDRLTLELKSLEKRFVYAEEERDDKGEWQKVYYWYRRVIDAKSDITYAPARVRDDGEDPAWVVAKQVNHDYGFCPVVWVQNLELDDAIDGDIDCPATTLPTMDDLDAIYSQASRGTKANTDPTLVISANGEMGEGIQTGSDNVIKTDAAGKASFLEMAGTSITIAMSMGTELRRQILEVAQCVLDADSAGAAKTATEVNRNYASMHSKAGTLREQWADHAILPLLHMMLRGVSILAERTGGGLKLRGWDGAKAANGLAMVPEMPDGVDLEVKWPEFFNPAVSDVQAAATAATAAKAGGVIDQLTATKFVAPFFKIEDAEDVAAKAAKEMQQAPENDLAQASIDGLNAGAAKKPRLVSG